MSDRNTHSWIVFDCVTIKHDDEREINSIWLLVKRTHKFKMARSCRRCSHQQLTVIRKIPYKRLKILDVLSMCAFYNVDDFLKHSIRCGLSILSGSYLLRQSFWKCSQRVAHTAVPCTVQLLYTCFTQENRYNGWLCLAVTSSYK